MSLWTALVNHLAPTKSPYLVKGSTMPTMPEFKDIGTPADGDAYKPASMQREQWLRSNAQASVAPAAAAQPTTATAPVAPATPRPIPAIQKDVETATSQVASAKAQIAAHQAAIVQAQSQLASAQNDAQRFGTELKDAVAYVETTVAKAVTDAKAFLAAHGL
jgi:hypothetical protein